MFDYISEAVLMLLDAKCKNIVCPKCGKHHSVTFSTDDSRTLLRWDFPEPGTCEGFKEQVNNLINTEASRDNLDLLSRHLGLK